MDRNNSEENDETTESPQGGEKDVGWDSNFLNYVEVEDAPILHFTHTPPLGGVILVTVVIDSNDGIGDQSSDLTIIHGVKDPEDGLEYLVKMNGEQSLDFKRDCESAQGSLELFDSFDSHIFSIEDGEGRWIPDPSMELLHEALWAAHQLLI
tara:strand:+ start:6310 stop:6765 length:456 start_codon:yes stop_codon:yes gene_type:complete